jgi:hypothetical protein
MGGIDIARKDRPIQPLHHYREYVNQSTGEIIRDDTAWHGGHKSPPLLGLKCGWEIAVTRSHSWKSATQSSCFRGGGHVGSSAADWAPLWE